MMCGLGIGLLLPVIPAVFFGETNLIPDFAAPGAAALALALWLFLSSRRGFLRGWRTSSAPIRIQYGFLSLMVMWLVMILLSAVPYYLSDSNFTFADSIFTSAAGWTSTGALAVPNTEFPMALLFWKGLTNWACGILTGLIPLTLLPQLGVNEHQIPVNEFSSPNSPKMTAKLYKTALIPLILYLGITGGTFLLLLIGGMKPYYAFLNTLSSVGTAGLIDVTGASAGFTINHFAEGVISLASLLTSLNVFFYYYLFRRKFKTAFGIYEIKAYFRLIIGVSLVLALTLRMTGTYQHITTSLWNGFIQTISFFTTSGYRTANIASWPTLAKSLLFLAAIIGGCSFSAAGGLSVIRTVIGFRVALRGIYKRIHPQAVKPILLNGIPVRAERASSVTGYILLYFSLFLLAAVLIAIDGQDLETTLCAAMGCLSNCGTSFGKLTGGDYSIFTGWGKIICSVLMAAGRLEIYPVIILFAPSLWKPTVHKRRMI